MAIDTSLLVATIASAGVVGSASIQGWTTRSATRRADAGRDDEREQDRLRRREDRENERLVREEERSFELQRHKVEAQAAADSERQAAQRDAVARAAAVVAEFVGQAEKCLVRLRRNHLMGEGLMSVVGQAEWDILATLLGTVTAVCDSADDRQWASLAVDSLIEATFGESNAVQQLQQAESYLRNLNR